MTSISMQKTDLNEELFDHIIHMARLIKREIVAIPHADAFTLLQLEILVYLYKGKKTKSVDIAKHFLITKPTTSVHLTKLEQSGIVARVQDQKDKRVDWISLTTKGERLLSEGMKQKRISVNKFLTLISEEEKKQLLTIVKNLIKTLENNL